MSRASTSDAAADDLDAESRNVSGLIFQMTTHVSAFKRAVDVLGTGKDTRELRAKLHDQREKLGRDGARRVVGGEAIGAGGDERGGRGR